MTYNTVKMTMSNIDSRHVQYILCCLTGQNEKKNSNQHKHSPGIEVIRLWQNLPDHMHRRLNKQCKNPRSSQSVLSVTLSYYGYCYLYSIDLLRKHSSNGKYVHAFQQYQIRSQHNQCIIASRIVNSLWDKTKHIRYFHTRYRSSVSVPEEPRKESRTSFDTLRANKFINRSTGINNPII